MKLRQLTGAACMIVLAYGCKTSGNGGGRDSAVLDDDSTTPSENSILDTVVGLDVLQNVPVVTQIPANIQPTSDWGYSSGKEYWLYSSRGKYMTFSTGKYAPYQNAGACAGKENDPTSACSVSPGKVAQACQYISSMTLKGIMASNPTELSDLKAEFGGNLSLFGWMNDGNSDGQYSTATWQGPFIWRGSGGSIQVGAACPTDYTQLSGYIKWVASVDRYGKCKSPSRGQFNALLAKVKECLQQNNAGN